MWGRSIGLHGCVCGAVYDFRSRRGACLQFVQARHPRCRVTHIEVRNGPRRHGGRGVVGQPLELAVFSEVVAFALECVGEAERARIDGNGGIGTRDAEEEPGGLAGVGALTLADVEGVGGAAQGLVGFGRDVGAECEGEGVDGVGEVAGGGDAGAAVRGLLDLVEHGLGLAEREPCAEGEDGGAVVGGDVVERGVGGDDFVQDLVELFGGWVEGDEAAHAADGDSVYIVLESRRGREGNGSVGRTGRASGGWVVMAGCAFRAAVLRVGPFCIFRGEVGVASWPGG